MLGFTVSAPSGTFTARRGALVSSVRGPHGRTPAAARGRHHAKVISATASESRVADKTATVQIPEGMTAEWAEAVQRLCRAVPFATFSDADTALDQCDGDEMEALSLLTESIQSPIKAKREEAAAAAGPDRVSVMKEAAMRRAATGSARDFFKGYVEVGGTHVEEGYVDQDADAMSKMGNAISSLFGKKRQ